MGLSLHVAVVSGGRIMFKKYKCPQCGKEMEAGRDDYSHTSGCTDCKVKAESYANFYYPDGPDMSDFTEVKPVIETHLTDIERIERLEKKLGFVHGSLWLGEGD
jgi:tRNA(Ile2) C34 agmatinyltransferase TiaS